MSVLSPQKSPDRNPSDDSGREDTTNLKLLKVGECPYRRGERGTFYAIIKRYGKQFRRSLKTHDRKLAERRLATLREQLRRINGAIATDLWTFDELAARWFTNTLAYIVKPIDFVRPYRTQHPTVPDRLSAVELNQAVDGFLNAHHSTATLTAKLWRYVSLPSLLRILDQSLHFHQFVAPT